MWEIMKNGVRDVGRGVREGIAADGAMSMMGNVHRQVEPRSPHETTQPALRAEENMQTGLRPMKLKPTSPAAREGSGVSPPLVRGGVSAADRRGVLWYARTVGQFVSCVTFGRRTLTIRPGSIQRFSLDSRKNFRIKKEIHQHSWWFFTCGHKGLLLLAAR